MQELKIQDPREEKKKANIEPYWITERERIGKLCEAIKANMDYNIKGNWETAKIYAKEIAERCELVERMKNRKGESYEDIH